MVKSGQNSETGESAKISHVAKLHVKISHGAKISQPAKSSQHCKIFCNSHSPFVFSSNCHPLCSCHFELGSGSSHLNWLEDSGTIGL